MSVRDGLLALLDGGPRHGYQLKTEFEAATGGVWALNVGQVYTTLDRLHRDGLVAVQPPAGGTATGTHTAAGSGSASGTGTAAGEPDRRSRDQKRYALTAAGREALGAWWEAVPADDPPPRDELQLKVLLAIEHGRDHALEVITRQRTALVRLLQQQRRPRRPGHRGRPAGPPGSGASGAGTGGETDPDPARPGPAGPDRTGLAASLVADAVAVRAEADLRWLDLCETRLLRAGDGPSPEAT